MPTHRDVHSNYPPSPPQLPPRLGPPSLRINTANSQRPGPSHGRSDARQPPLYDLPSKLDSPTANPSARARPGGLAAMHGSRSTEDPARVRSPPGTPHSHAARSRRGSQETTVRPSAARRESDQSLPMPSRRDNARGRSSPSLPLLKSPTIGGSVFSGREGSSHAARLEAAGPTQADLQLFAHHCRLFYFSPTPAQESSSFISSTLAALPPSHRATYTRLQSSFRSLAHLHHLRVRISSFHALMSSTVASASLTPLARSEPSGSRARSERKERLTRFISTWCTTGAGGVEPFFRGLWAVLRVQSRGEQSRGGAGASRVVWEIDDAVFLESGGSEFMHEAVMMLKGVLGFDDQPLTAPPKLRRIRTIPRSYSDARLRRPQAAPSRSSPRKPPPQQEELLESAEAPPADPSRTRAISDPFTDARTGQRRPSGRGPAPPPPPSRSLHRSAVSQPVYAAEPASHAESPLLQRDDPMGNPLARRMSEDRELLLGNGRTMSDDSMGPSGLFANGHHVVDNAIVEDDEDDPTEDDIAAEESELNQPRFRLWVFPAHIADPEAEMLLGLFPAFIRGGRGDVRFPFMRPGRGVKDLESGTEPGWDTIVLESQVVAKVPKLDLESEEGVIRHGTGRMWAGLETRTGGWAGGGWYRFKRWWRRLFGMG